MNNKISENVCKILQCPQCDGSLLKSNKTVTCSNCQTRFEHTNSGVLDLRLQKPKNFQYQFSLGTPLFEETDIEFSTLQKNSNPEVDFSNMVAPVRLSSEIMSHFPKAINNSSIMLDLGCGNAIHRKVCEHAGFEYVGMDYESSEATMLGDVHALPFKDESFYFVLSISVLQYARYPFIMMKEVSRVLKNNGKFIGTVAFLEPFHETFYHHTHLGTYNSLQEGGFKIEKVCPSEKWSVLVAQAQGGLFPKMPFFLAKSIVMPLQILHKMWWRLGRLFPYAAQEETRIRNMTGSFTFIAQKGVTDHSTEGK